MSVPNEPATTPVSERSRESGFSLIELLAAITLFSLIIVGFVFARNNAIDQVGRASDTRVLRYLASYQMGELRFGFDPNGNEYEVGDNGGDFSHLGNQYADYTWSGVIEEVIAAGPADEDGDIPSLFGEDEEDEWDTSTEEPKGDPVKIYKITLTIIEPNGLEDDGLTMVTFKPVPPEAREDED